MLINEFHKAWKRGICVYLEGCRKEYFDFFEAKLSGGGGVDAEDWSEFEFFIKYYNYSRLVCSEEDELKLPDPELVPSLDWIRHILFPDQYPDPDTIRNDSPGFDM